MPTRSSNRANSIVAKFGAAADNASLTINNPAISSTSRRSSHPAATASAGEAIAATAAGTVTMVAAAPLGDPQARADPREQRHRQELVGDEGEGTQRDREHRQALAQGDIRSHWNPPVH